MTKPRRERRKKPRAKGTGKLLLALESQPPGAQIKDISVSGINFTADAPLEFMTRLVMTIVFPGEKNPGGEPASSGGIQCEGAVVRCEPVKGGDEGKYEIAVFFTSLEQSASGAIEEYVRTH